MAPTVRRNKPAKSPKKKPPNEPHWQPWQFCLYIAGQTPKSAGVLANLRAICERHLASNWDLQVVDILKNPALARIEQIVAVPMLVRLFPLPPRRLVGNLSDHQRVLIGLELDQPDTQAEVTFSPGS